MKVRLTRNIYHHTPKTGLTSKIFFKDYEWNIPPVIGATIDDSVWDRNDITKIENINIIAEEANHYDVELTAREVDDLNVIDKFVDIAKSHGWEVLY